LFLKLKYVRERCVGKTCFNAIEEKISRQVVCDINKKKRHPLRKHGLASKAALLVGMQGCQMAHFHTKNANFGHILEGLGIDYFGGCISWPFGIFCRFGIFYGH
jgi:hypothetical protein